jgi:hypothetical protein
VGQQPVGLQALLDRRQPRVGPHPPAHRAQQVEAAEAHDVQHRRLQLGTGPALDEQQLPGPLVDPQHPGLNQGDHGGLHRPTRTGGKIGQLLELQGARLGHVRGPSPQGSAAPARTRSQERPGQRKMTARDRDLARGTIASRLPDTTGRNSLASRNDGHGSAPIRAPTHRRDSRGTPTRPSTGGSPHRLRHPCLDARLRRRLGQTDCRFSALPGHRPLRLSYARRGRTVPPLLVARHPRGSVPQAEFAPPVPGVDAAALTGRRLRAGLGRRPRPPP